MVNESSIEAIFNTILITSVIYGFIFIAVLFFSKKKKGKPLLFLGLIVLFISLNNLQAWLIDLGFTCPIVYIKYLRIPWYFLCMPLFYAFLVHYLKIQRKINSFLNLTVGLFIFGIIARILLIYYTQIINEIDPSIILKKFNSYEEIGSFSYALIILIYPIFIFKKNRELLKFVMNYDDLVWIRHFLNMGGVILFFWLISIVINFNGNKFSEPIIYYPLRLCTSVLIYWIGFKGLLRYRLMEDRIMLRESLKSELRLNTKNLELVNASIEIINNNQTEKQHELFNKINTYILEQKKYLDPYMSLESLSEELNMSSGHLSSLINKYSNMHFSDYINDYRVKQVKKIIIDETYAHYTIVAIGLESGFNSKSTFYAAFKKFTNLSPIQFKKQFAAN
jgi:AraC-like DNA-binding protein